jgi:hypothetical protein
MSIDEPMTLNNELFSYQKRLADATMCSSDWWFWYAALCHVHHVPCVAALSNALLCGVDELQQSTPSTDHARLFRRVARASGPLYTAAVARVHLEHDAILDTLDVHGTDVSYTEELNG